MKHAKHVILWSASSTPFYVKIVIRKNNLNRLILAHININSIRNKFDMLASQVKGNVDVIMIAERKLDYIFLVD